MKSMLFLIAGITGALAYMLIQHSKLGPVASAPAVDDLAHKLQDAWVDHHTVA